VPYVFTPPTYSERNVNGGRLLSWYSMTRSFSVVKEGGQYRNVIYVASELFDTAEKVYQGGYRHVISDVEAADLIAAGYEVEGP
jgi:hypothetical protein